MTTGTTLCTQLALARSCEMSPFSYLSSLVSTKSGISLELFSKFRIICFSIGILRIWFAYLSIISGNTKSSSRLNICRAGWSHFFQSYPYILWKMEKINFPSFSIQLGIIPRVILRKLNNSSTDPLPCSKDAVKWDRIHTPWAKKGLYLGKIGTFFLHIVDKVFKKLSDLIEILGNSPT